MATKTKEGLEPKLGLCIPTSTLPHVAFVQERVNPIKIRVLPESLISPIMANPCRVGPNVVIYTSAGIYLSNDEIPKSSLLFTHSTVYKRKTVEYLESQ